MKGKEVSRMLFELLFCLKLRSPIHRELRSWCEHLMSESRVRENGCHGCPEFLQCLYPTEFDK